GHTPPQWRHGAAKPPRQTLPRVPRWSQRLREPRQGRAAAAPAIAAPHQRECAAPSSWATSAGPRADGSASLLACARSELADLSTIAAKTIAGLGGAPPVLSTDVREGPLGPTRARRL